MANRNFPQSKIFGFNMLPVAVRGSVVIGGTGAVGAISAPGVKAITRLAQGIYQIQLEDNYYSFLRMQAVIEAPVTGSGIAAGSLTPGLVYQIVTMGTSTQANWVTAGVPSGVTAAVGTVFLCAATSSGNGTAKLLGASGITNIEMVGAQGQDMLSNQPYVARFGGFITFQCMGPTDASTTTPIAKDPASGSKIFFEILLNNSSVQ